ncbi:MAG: DUF2382 domain-containing protein [Thermomicrobiales bacterium]
MTGQESVHEGMPVYGPGDELLGTVTRMQGDGFDLADSGRHIPLNAVDRVTRSRVYIRGSLDQYQADRRTGQDEIVVPVAEERLNVEKRAGQLGTVDIHKTVTEEQQTVPVELRREEVHVEERDVPDRPLRAGEDVLQEGTIRVPVRGEEAVVEKEAVVTGEVVVSKDQTTARQEVRDTVRKQDVEVDQSRYREARPAKDAATSATAETAAGAAAMTTPPTTSAESVEAAMSPRGQVQMGLDVIGADNAMVGRVKEVRANDFLVDRSMQRDIYVPFTAVQDVNQSGVMLTVASNEVDDQDWEKPSLF